MGLDWLSAALTVVPCAPNAI